ncbi:MAG: pyridoxal phosphate-dependent aminotransferase [Bryobacteraceae bacterium]
MYSLSQRLKWDSRPTPFSEAILQQRRQPGELLDLTSSNPTAVDLPYPNREIACALSTIPSLAYDPQPLGQWEARKAISAYYGDRGFDVHPSRIVVTASSSEAYSYLFKLLCDPGDEMLSPKPSYPLFEYLAALDSIRVQPYWVTYDGAWYTDLDDLESRITDRTRGIILVNPNNPTGSFLKAGEADRLCALARRRSLPLISDEVFMDYELCEGTQRVLSLTGRSDTLSFSLNGLSKSAAMPQMKIGWIVINGPTEQVEAARQGLELIADTYLSVSSPCQLVLPQLINLGAGIRSCIRERILGNAQALQDLLRGSPAHPLYTEGGWSSIVQLPQTLPEEDWVMRLLTRYGVIVQPGYLFDMPGEPFAVVSLLTPTGKFVEGVTAMRAASEEEG